MTTKNVNKSEDGDEARAISAFTPAVCCAELNVLNLYAGLGGNRKLWGNVNVTAVEKDPKIAEVYQSLNPNDTVIVGDAHQYLLEHHQEFEFVWTSPPCQSHSKMDRANCRNKPRYADLKLYEEIIFLRTYFNGKWVVENVRPYYEPLIQPTCEVGRHLFWTNFLMSVRDVRRPKNFIASGTQATPDELKKWLGLEYDGNLYYEGNHCPSQVLRNCVHPEIGRQILQQSLHNADVMCAGQTERNDCE